jgi:hypothetical protein
LLVSFSPILPEKLDIEKTECFLFLRMKGYEAFAAV